MITYIKFNNSNLGKRYVVMKYYQWELRETYPYDNLADIKLRWFRLRELKWICIAETNITNCTTEIC